MTDAPASRSRGVVSAAWRILIAMSPLGAGLTIATALLSSGREPSDPATLTLRIATGVAISTLTIAVIVLLVRYADRGRMRDAGVTSIRNGWRLFAYGALIWTVPAALTFGALALLDVPLRITAPATDLALTVILLGAAVLLTEAVPEELVFRGYITAALGRCTRGWGIIVVQAILFTFFARLLRQNWNPADLSLFLTMGIGFGYLRMVTGSVWMPIGFHTAFQTGAQLVLTHDVVEFAGGSGIAMLALGVVPFSAAAILVSSTGASRVIGPARGQ